MKKILLLLTIALFSFSGLFAQWEDLTVSWYVTGDCDCTGSIDSVFKVTMKIYDVANENENVKNDTNWESGASSSSIFDVDDVKYYCEELNQENTPNFTIIVTVEMYCKNPSQVLECKGKVTVTGKSCYDFANGLVTIPQIEVKP